MRHFPSLAPLAAGAPTRYIFPMPTEPPGKPRAVEAFTFGVASVGLVFLIGVAYHSPYSIVALLPVFAAWLAAVVLGIVGYYVPMRLQRAVSKRPAASPARLPTARSGTEDRCCSLLRSSLNFPRRNASRLAPSSTHEDPKFRPGDVVQSRFQRLDNRP